MDYTNSGFMKSAEREKARQLRKEGKSLNEIVDELQVSKGSVSVWVRDVQLSSKQKKSLARRNPSVKGNIIRNQKRSLDAKRKRELHQNEGRAYARKMRPLHIMGCMLHWGEGHKDRNTLQISNSDPDLLRLYLKFLNDELQIEKSNIAITCNAHTANGFSEKQIRSFWLRELDLPALSWKKVYWDKRTRTSSGSGVGKLPYGVLRLSVHNTQVAQHVYGAIQEYSSSNKPHWVE
jgi:hypothetical protein